MKPAVLILSALAACTAAEPIERAGPTPDAIAHAVRGRTPGPPVACISQFGLRGSRAVAGAMLFRGPGDVIYVNEGIAGCRALALGTAFRTHNPTGRLCRGDIVTAFEPVSGAEFGGCALGDFVPYRRTNRSEGSRR